MRRPVFGLRLLNSGPLASSEVLRKIAVAADQLGFGAVTAHDHVTLGPGEKYHFSDGTAEKLEELESRGVPTSTFYETVSLLSYVAGITERVKLIPTCWVLSWRHPVLFAKQAVTLHELSGERLIFCTAIGNLRSDFDVMGVPRNKRGKITNEYLEVLRRIFSDQRSVSFQGEFVSFPGTEFYPKPKNMPIWIGGAANRFAYERIAKYGNGWFAGGDSPDDFVEARTELDKYMRKHGRSIDEIEVGQQTFLRIGSDMDARALVAPTIHKFFSGREDAGKAQTLIRKSLVTSFVGTPDHITRLVQQYLEAGVTTHDMRLLSSSVDDALTTLKTFARDVIPSFD